MARQLSRHLTAIQVGWGASVESVLASMAIWPAAVIQIPRGPKLTSGTFSRGYVVYRAVRLMDARKRTRLIVSHSWTDSGPRRRSSNVGR